MKFRLFALCVAPVLAIGLIGLSGLAQNREEPAANAAKPQPEQPARGELAGKWRLVLTQEGTDFPLLVLEVARQGDAFSAQVLDTHRQFGGAKVESTRGDGTSLQFVLSANEGEKYEFQGRLANGVVYGNLMFDGGRCDPARLIATDAAELGDAKPGANPDLDALRAAVRSDDSAAALARFARENAESPLSLVAWQQAVVFASGKDDAEKKVRALADEYAKASERWGARMVATARINVALALVRRDKLPGYAEESIAAAETAADATLKESLAPIVGLLREALAEQKRREAVLAAREAVIRGKDEAAKKQAVELLQKLVREHPLDPVILFTLAQHAENEKRIDDAIELYSRLAILPQMEGMLFSMLEAEEDADAPYPGESARRLWEEKHKGLDGFDKYLHEVYRRSIHSFAGSPAPAQPAGNHTVLVELFTGAECPPCVAADVATGAIEAAFPKEQVVILRYHQHIPGPDPLTSPDGWNRFRMYGLQGTPSVLLDGEPIDGVAGPLYLAPQGYKRLRSAIDPLVAKPSPAKIELSAKAADGKLDLSAKVEGLDGNGKKQLVLALAEAEVPYRAGNGILHHEMIVRAMPAGPQGAEATDGKLSVTKQLALADFKGALEKYLTDFEEEEGVEFPEKPLALDKLYLVAFVQDAETGKVLGTRAVPVEGKLEYPPAEKKPADAQEKPADAPQP